MSFDLTKIGQMLKTRREELHLSLQKISDVLFIRKRIIEAIEAGDWNSLPHMVYVKGYVGQYASFLGIQQKIDEELNQDDGISIEQETGLVDKFYISKPSWWLVKKKHIGYAAVAMLVLGFIVFQNVQRRLNSVIPTFQGSSIPIRAVTGTPYEVQGDKVIAEAKKLMIVCQQRTWVRIIIDGLEKKEFIMNPEEVVVINGKESFDLLIGNAGGVKLFYNGKDMGFSGAEGEVRRINLS